MNYFTTLQNAFNNKTWTFYDKKYFILEEQDKKLLQIPEDEASSSGYQVLIQTSDENLESKNILTKDNLLKHVNLMYEIVNMKIKKFGIDWTLRDICFKPGELDIDSDSETYDLKSTLEKLIPCIWITPIDCFFEGSKPIGPNPPIDTRFFKIFLITKY